MTRDEYRKVQDAGIGQTVQFLEALGLESGKAGHVASDSWEVAFKYHASIEPTHMLSWINTIAKNRRLLVLQNTNAGRFANIGLTFPL
jgi:hypothetical protein